LTVADRARLRGQGLPPCAKADRPGLDATLDYGRQGDTLIVWRRDRLGRSPAHLIDSIAELEERGLALRSLTEPQLAP